MTKKIGKFNFIFQYVTKYVYVLIFPSLTYRNNLHLSVCLFNFSSAAEYSLRMQIDPQSVFVSRERKIKFQKFKEKQNLMIK